MYHKRRISDIIEAHIVMKSLTENIEFSVSENDKYINVLRKDHPYLKIWYVDPIVIQFGYMFDLKQKPSKKWGMIEQELKKTIKFQKYEQFEEFYNKYVL